MTAENLNKLLDNKITVDDFRLSIGDEFDNYKRLMDQKGSTIDIRFLEDEEIQLDTSRFKKLLDLVITDRLSNVHLSYICDCLTWAENLILDEKTKDLIFELANPEINGGYVDKRTLTDMVLRIK